MDTNSRGFWALAAIIILIIAVAAVVYYVGGTTMQAPAIATGTQNIVAVFTCDSGKSINATFMQGESLPPTTAGGPPTPGGSVQLVLSDGRDLTLPQTISADGARYANSDESFIFWNKGNGAFITENGTTTFNNCIDENSQ